MMQALAEYLQDEGAGLLGDGGRGHPIRLIKTSSARGIAARINVFVFCGVERRPRLVCHVARHASAEERMRQEWLVRNQIMTRLPERLRATLPHPLALERIADTLVLVEQALGGVPLVGAGGRRWEMGRRRRVGAELAAVASWLCDFQGATETRRRAWTVQDEEEHVAQSLAKVGRWLRAGAIQALLEPLRERVRPLRGAEIGWPAHHGDLWHGNVLTAKHGVGVVDWEGTRSAGPSFVDPLTFAFQYLHWEADPHAPGSADGAMRHPAWLRSAVSQFLLATLGPLSEDAACLEAAFLVSLLARCRMVRRGEGPPVALLVLMAALRRRGVLSWLRGA